MAPRKTPLGSLKQKIKQLENEIDRHFQEEQRLENQLHFEEILSDLSAKFISVPTDRVDRKINEALERIGSEAGVDSCDLVKISALTQQVSVIYTWPRGIGEHTIGTALSQRYPWATRKLIDGQTVVFNSLEDLPAAAQIDKEHLQDSGLRSLLLIPIAISGSPVYGIALGTTQNEVTWSKIHYRRLRLLGEVFANVLARKQSDQKLERAFLEIKKLKERAEAENVYLHEEISLQHKHGHIIGQSEAIKKVLAKIEEVAPTDSTVLITGETGTGKELVAWALHDHSRRNKHAMVKVNCAALPASLIENEIFGREKGAYTGAATQQVGRFEFADHSSIFLDEIGDISPEIQAKLLGVLEDGKFERLGSITSVHVDVRVITATNRNLEKRVKEGKFRQDLFFRINVYPIVVPPLRKRREDIPLLAWHFVKEFEEKMGKRIDTIPAKTMAALKAYPWPGNVRELRNVIEHAMIVTKRHTLRATVPYSAAVSSPGDLSLEAAQRRHILTVLNQCAWRIRGKNGASETLGVKPSTLYSRMEKLGIKRPA